MTLGLAGAVMDGTMVSYQGAGCTDFEFENADIGPCLREQESIDMFGTMDTSLSPRSRTRYGWQFSFNYN